MEQVEDFEHYLRTLSLKESSIRRYVNVFQNIPKYVFDSIDTINRFLSQRNREYNDTILYFAVIRHYLRFIGKYEWLNAIKYPRIKRIKRSPSYIPLEQIFRILDNLPTKKYRVAGYVQLFGGMRAFEVMGIKRKDINLFDDHAIVVVRTAKRDPYQSIIVGKGFQVLKNYLKDHFQENELIFCKPTNSKDEEHKIATNVRYYQEEIRKTAQSLGIVFRPHDLKRNLARFLRFEKGLSIEEVKEALHHARLETTLRYVGKIDKEKILNALKSI